MYHYFVFGSTSFYYINRHKIKKDYCIILYSIPAKTAKRFIVDVKSSDEQFYFCFS